MPLSRLLRMVLAFAIGLLFLLVLIVLLYLTQSAFEVWTHLKETPGWFLVGQVVEQYLAQGKSWGEGGPKQVVREILDGLDRSSILAQARSDITEWMRSV